MKTFRDSATPETHLFTDDVFNVEVTEVCKQVLGIMNH